MKRKNKVCLNKKARVAERQRALLLAKRSRSRAALAPTLSLPACVMTLKTGTVNLKARGISHVEAAEFQF